MVWRNNEQDIITPQNKDTNTLEYKFGKRLFDFVFSTGLLLLLWPLLCVIAAVVKATSDGPAFYIHKRVGMHGKTLELIKFRTMYSNADEIKANFTEEQIKEWNENYKLVHDPRLTRFGAFLRKTSLDELPQLVNILKGDLSFVGPRPVIAEELKKYGRHTEKFLSVIPGLTGYWQAYARNECTYEKRMEMELYYVDHASFSFDLQILARTVSRVLSQKGAM